MKNFQRYTPRYIVDRLSVLCYRKIHPDRPWLTPAANSILSTTLKPTDIGIEFGSGQSTLWFSKRIKHLSSIEHDENWYCRVRTMLAENNIANVGYHLIPRDVKHRLGAQSSYVKFLDKFEEKSIDFVLIDGLYRDHCTLRVLKLLRPGGILVIDNINKYLPSDTRSPNSRTLKDGPNGETWTKIDQELQNWRRIWTSSGVWDTGIFFRPCD